MKAEQSASGVTQETLSGQSVKHKPEQPLRNSPGLRKSIGDIQTVINLAEEYDSANLASASPSDAQFKTSGIQRDQTDFFSTMDIRVAMDTASGPTISATYPTASHHDHATLIDTQRPRNMLMQPQEYLEAAIYKTSIVQDKESLRGTVTDSNQHQMMGYESSLKDIFESSGVVQIQPEISPERMMTTGMSLTQTTSAAYSTTLQKQMEETSEVQPKPSFFTLFVIFGLDSATFVSENMKEEYKILGSYPNLEQHKEIASQHKFVQDLNRICFPEEDLRVERFKLMSSDPLCRHSFFHFISTNNMGEKQYLTSVHFKEIMLCEMGAFVIPKAICVASSQPIFSLQKQVLDQIFKKVVLQNNKVSTLAFKQATLTYEGFLDQYEQPPGHDFPNFVYKFMMDTIMCTNNRRIRDRSSPSRSPDRRHSKPMSREARQALPVVDLTPVLELYITIFSKHLYFDQSVERDIQITVNDTISPKQMFGKSPVGSSSLSKGNIRNTPIFTFRNLKPFGFQLENYPFELLLQSVKPEKLVELFTVMLLERKIVLIKNDIGNIALIMQSLIALLNPFQWCFSIITYLTRDLVDMLDAPFPFIIGVSTSTWEDICTLKDFPEELYVFDLESQGRRNIQRFEIPELPQPQGDSLLAGLKDIMEKKDHRLESIRKEQRQEKLKQRKLDERFDDYFWADAQLHVKQLFFNFLLETVGNYVQYYRTNEEQLERDTQALEKKMCVNNMKSSEDFFEFEAYLESREQMFEGNFMAEFIKSQTFHEFIEQQYGDKFENGEGAENASMFFDSCIDVLVEHDMSKLKAAQQEMIDTAMHNLATPVKYKFTGIITKYVDGLLATEKMLRANIEETETPSGSRGRRFADMIESDQIDEVIMNHIFMRYENKPGFHQFSLINEINENMICAEIPRINYDQVETYWRKKYKAKVRPESSRPHKKPLANTTVVKQKRMPTKAEREYDQYINGNQALTHADHFNIDVPLQTSKNRATVQHMASHRSIDHSNVIHDDQSESIGHSSIDVFNFRPGYDRQSQSTRNFNSNTVQKGQRTAYNKRNTNIAIDAMTQKNNKSAHKQANSLHNSAHFHGGKQLRLTKSPLMRHGKIRDIPRAPKGAQDLQSSKSQSGLMTTSAKATARTQSHVNTAKVHGIQTKKLTLNIHAKKPENFNEKVKLAKQRGSVHNLMALKSQQQELKLHKRVTTPSDWQNIEMSEAPPLEEITAKAFINDEENEPLRRQKQFSQSHISDISKPLQSGRISTRSGLEKETLPLQKHAARHYKQNKLVNSMRYLDLKQIKMEMTQNRSIYAKGRQASQLGLGNLRIKSVSNLQANKSSSQQFLVDSTRQRAVKKQATWEPSQLQDVPMYTEKKATTQVAAGGDSKTTVSRIKISIENNNVQDSFLNIVKSEEQSQVLLDSRTSHEVQHGEEPTPGHVNVELSPSVDPDNQVPADERFPEKRLPNGQIPEYQDPDYRGPSYQLPAYHEPEEGTTEEEVEQTYLTNELPKETNLGLETEMEDESHHIGLAEMTQKGNLMLEYRSKFSVADEARSAARHKMMPPPQQRHEFAMAPHRQQQVDSTSALFNKDVTDSAVLMHQNSGVSIESKSSPLLLEGGIGLSEKPPQRKGQATLSMLLQKTNSQPKRQSSSKMRSITEKQRNIQSFKFLSGKSQVSLPGYDNTTGMAQLQKTQSFPDDEERKQFQEENEDEGWFTGTQSKHISQLESQPVKATQETHKKLTQFYQDLDGSFMDNAVLPFDKQVPALHTLSIVAQEERVHQHRQQAVNFQPLTAAQQDSPQQSSMRSSEQLTLMTMRTQEGNYPSLSPNVVLGLAQSGADEEEKKAADNSITAPMDGILFSHQKRRNEKYRNYF